MSILQIFYFLFLSFHIFLSHWFCQFQLNINNPCDLRFRATRTNFTPNKSSRRTKENARGQNNCKFLRRRIFFLALPLKLVVSDLFVYSDNNRSLILYALKWFKIVNRIWVYEWYRSNCSANSEWKNTWNLRMESKVHRKWNLNKVRMKLKFSYIKAHLNCS